MALNLKPSCGLLRRGRGIRLSYEVTAMFGSSGNRALMVTALRRRVVVPISTFFTWSERHRGSGYCGDWLRAGGLRRLAIGAQVFNLPHNKREFLLRPRRPTRGSAAGRGARPTKSSRAGEEIKTL